MIEAVFMFLALILLVYIAYMQYKTFAIAQVTLAMLYSFIVSVEESEEHGTTQQLH